MQEIVKQGLVGIATNVLEGLFNLLVSAKHKDLYPGDILNHINTVRNGLVPFPEQNKTDTTQESQGK